MAFIHYCFAAPAKQNFYSLTALLAAASIGLRTRVSLLIADLITWPALQACPTATQQVTYCDPNGQQT